MKKVTFDLEVVTPLFLGGADGITPELRPPSIRGAMRWWFRAMLGGILFPEYSGKELIAKLYEKEATLWGTTKASGKVIVRVSGDFKHKEFDFKKPGLKYLGYGLGEKNRRRYIPETTKFKLDLIFRGASKDEEKIFIQTLWLLTNLGNLGARSRRGWGGVRVTNPESICGISFGNNLDPRKLEDHIKTNLEKIRDSFLQYSGLNHLSEPKKEPPFSMLFPKCEDLWPLKIVDKPYNSALEALNDIGERLRKFREYRETTKTLRSDKHYYVTKDYDVVKRFTTSPENSPTAPLGSIFGLPHQFQFRSSNKKVTIKGERHERRASPLYIKIFQCGERFVPILHVLRASFLENREKLLFEDITSKKTGTSDKPPSYLYLFCFLNEL